MATQWVLGKITDALAPTVSSGVASAGSFVGGAVNAVGNSINGVGEGINSSIRRYGDGVKDYGNGVMDWTAAEGVRSQTASNPLGLASGSFQGKRTVTSPQVYRSAPKPSASKTLMTTNKAAAPQKKIAGGTPRKALPAPLGTSKPTSTKSTSPIKKIGATAPTKTPSAPNPGAMRKPAATTNKGASTPAKSAAPVKKATAVKPSAASAPKPSIVRSKVQGNPTAAANPLGLSF